MEIPISCACFFSPTEFPVAFLLIELSLIDSESQIDIRAIKAVAFWRAAFKIKFKLFPRTHTAYPLSFNSSIIFILALRNVRETKDCDIPRILSICFCFTP